MHELDEFDDELLDELELEVIEQHEHDEHKLEDETHEMLELVNSMVEMVVELMDMVDDEVGGDEIEVNEMVVEMMINDEVEEVDM